MKHSASAYAVAVATSVIACVALLRPVHADPPMISPGAIPRGPAVSALDPAKKQLRFNEVAKANGLSAIALGSLQEVRLTPVAPRAAGAEIDRTSGILFSGTAPGQPDGSYTMMRVWGSMPLSSIDLKFPTQPNKFYMFDCKVGVTPQSKISWGRSGVQGVSTSPIQDGHMIGGFMAASGSTTFTLTYGTTDGNAAVLGHFYGCDFMKAN